MCGIVGLAGFEVDPQTATRMRESLVHRGPDDGGEWRDERKQLWLAHRRLSIIDLSPEGRQPMVSASGRYVLTYNGEVYNYRALRKELERDRIQFRGGSDTEVILAAIEAWGLERALSRFIGMFAFGLYDSADDSLYLVRDRMGVKPLYYAVHGNKIAFASELTALAPLKWIDREIDRDAVAAYFQYLTVPAPATVYKGVRKVLPAHILCWRNGITTLSCYWDLTRLALDRSQHTSSISIEDASQELEALLKDSIRLRMVADVPLGCFLSGGVDSSTVAALMQSMVTKPVETFSIGFEDESHDESRFAARVAQHLGTSHRELKLTKSEAVGLVKEALNMLDEPFADNSIVPTYALARLARQRVTVVMSGDGGDELFGGYPRYFWADRIVAARRRLTPPGARVAASLLSAVPAAVWDGPVQALTGGRFSRAGGLSARVRRFAEYLQFDTAEGFDRMRSAWKRDEAIVRHAANDRPRYWAQQFDRLDWASQMMLADQLHYLPDDILHKVDRASMAVSLEAREPLLDHRIVEWSWTLPKACKLAPSGDRGKMVLREVLRRYVPDALIERPKSGFGLPVGAWLRQELRPWADALLFDDTQWPEFLDRDMVRAAWRRHLAAGDLASRIWPVLAFLNWYRSAANSS